MNKVIASTRLCLIGRKDELEHLLAVGIEDDADWYEMAYECFVLLNSIEKNERTPIEILQRKYLLDLIDIYEEKYYRYGN